MNYLNLFKTPIFNIALGIFGAMIYIVHVWILSDKIDKANQDLQTCELKLNLQNAQIKALQIKPSAFNQDKIKEIQKIYLKDEKCESELNAYKKMFSATF